MRNMKWFGLGLLVVALFGIGLWLGLDVGTLIQTQSTG